MNIQDRAKKCRYCGQDVSAVVLQGESLCPSCGRSFTNGYNSNLSRKWLSVLFWAIFLATPVLTLLTMAFGLGIPILITGTLICRNRPFKTLCQIQFKLCVDDHRVHTFCCSSFTAASRSRGAWSQ